MNETNTSTNLCYACSSLVIRRPSDSTFSMQHQRHTPQQQNETKLARDRYIDQKSGNDQGERKRRSRRRKHGIKVTETKEIRESKFKIKVVEKSGTKVKDIVHKKDPFKLGKCNRLDCLVCSTGGKGNCSKENVTYLISCTEEFTRITSVLDVRPAG